MIVDHRRRAARDVVTVQLDEAGGRRPAMPFPPHPLTHGALPLCGPHGRSTYTASQAGGSLGPALYQYTRSFGPATWLGLCHSSSNQASSHKSGVLGFHLESNRDDASPLRAFALRAWDAPGSQAVQSRKVPVSKEILLGRYHSDGMVFLKVGRCQETL